MRHLKVLTMALLAVPGMVIQSAHAVEAPNWVGTADYTAGPGPGGEMVGPFSTYDFGSGVVLLEPTATLGLTTSYDGSYQSFVTNHEFLGNIVSAPMLNSGYELTAVATFKQDVTFVSPTTSDISVKSGTFNLYLDSAPNRSFSTDSGFNNGAPILTGNILSGTGSSITMGGSIYGVTGIQVKVTDYDTSIFAPGTLDTLNGIFTLSMGNPLDAPLTGSVSSVLGRSVGGGNLLFAADGNVTVSAIPEANTYAMMLAGLGLVAFTARRRSLRR